MMGSSAHSIYTKAHTQTHARKDTHMHTCTHIGIILTNTNSCVNKYTQDPHICTCIQRYSSRYIYIYTHAHKYTYTHTYLHTYTGVYTRNKTSYSLTQSVLLRCAGERTHRQVHKPARDMLQQHKRDWSQLSPCFRMNELSSAYRAKH